MQLDTIKTIAVVSSEGLLQLEQTPDGLWGKGPVCVQLERHAARLEIRVSAGATCSVSTLRIVWASGIPTGARVLGDAWERSYGDLEWRGIVPDRPMPWYFAASDGVRLSAAGVMTGARAFCCWQADETRTTLTLDVRSGGAGVLLKGRALDAATVVTFASADGETPHTALARFVKQLCPRPILPAQPVYGFNDWYYAYGRNTAAGILRDSALCSALAENAANRPFSVIDAGWQRGATDATDRRNSDPTTFPDMPGLAASITQAGCRPGIWFRPLLVAAEIPGRTLPAARFPHGMPGIPCVLDPSIPENLEAVKTDVQGLCAWGFELLKHDFSTFDIFGAWGFEMGGAITRGGWSFADPSRTSAEILIGLYQAIREAAGTALILGCNTVGHLNAGQAQLQRSGDDTSGQEWARTRKMGVNTLAFRVAQHQSFFAIDADCVGITEQIPWTLNRQWLDLVARSGTALFVSAKPTAMGKAQCEAVKRAFTLAAAERPVAEPLDWFDSSCPTLWSLGGEITRFRWAE